MPGTEVELRERGNGSPLRKGGSGEEKQQRTLKKEKEMEYFFPRKLTTW